MRLLLALVVFGAVLVAGCESGHEQTAPSPTSGAEGARGMTEDGGPAPIVRPRPTEGTDAQLTQFQKDYETAKSAYAKDPKSPKAKEALVITTVRLGTATMVSPALESRVKYRRALELYREALKLDPENHEALANKKQIEDVYRSMGREIPQ